MGSEIPPQVRKDASARPASINPVPGPNAGEEETPAPRTPDEAV